MENVETGGKMETMDFAQRKEKRKTGNTRQDGKNSWRGFCKYL